VQDTRRRAAGAQGRASTILTRRRAGSTGADDAETGGKKMLLGE
jgi:hypothetical protein